MNREPHFLNILIVIGASAGGLAPIKGILTTFQQGMQETHDLCDKRMAQNPRDASFEDMSQHTLEERRC